jgi:hypothetical protein
LSLKAELVFAWLLITRHRAPRLALLLVASLVVLLKLENDPQSLSVREHSLVLMAGILSSIAASRVTARGAVLASVRRTASSRWLVPVGRLCGVLLFALLPVTLASGILVDGSDRETAFPLLALLPLYLSAISGVVMAVTPVAGASAAAGLGLLACLAGGFPPSQLRVLLEKAAFFQAPAVHAWNVLPLSWRVTHALVSGGVGDALVLASWAALGLGLTAWVGTQPRFSTNRIADA